MEGNTLSPPACGRDSETSELVRQSQRGEPSNAAAQPLPQAERDIKCAIIYKSGNIPNHQYFLRHSNAENPA